MGELSLIYIRSRSIVRPDHRSTALRPPVDELWVTPERGSGTKRRVSSAETIDVLFVLDPLSTLNPRADTSYVMITEALRRGHRPWYATLDDLLLDGERALAHARRMAPRDDHPLSPMVDASLPELRSLESFAAVLMRKDPPVDESFVTATWILDRAKAAGARVINDPTGLRELNEKLSILAFPSLIPRTRLVRQVADVRAALADFGGHMILKPVYGFGGREILQGRTEDPNLSTLIELATHEGRRWTVAQEFIPAAREGDKRILLVDGEPIGAVMRVPARGELRNNFHTGGSPEATDLSERDREICAAVGPVLRERGQFFAGIDVIGRHLTEINVTSPTGMQEINRLGGLDGEATMQARFWELLEARIGR